MTRAWSFRVNRPPVIGVSNMLNNGAFGDPRRIARGYDGRLRDGNGTLLASVNTWQAQINIRTVDHQPAGYKTVWAIPVSQSITLTFTEVLVNDLLILANILDAFREQNSESATYIPDPVLNFQGIISGH